MKWARNLEPGDRSPWGIVRSVSTERGHNDVLFTSVTVEPFGNTYTVCADTVYEHGREVRP